MTDLGIFVAFLIFGMISPCVIICKNLFVTISLFLSWLLSSSQFKIRIPSLVNLEESLLSRSAFSSSESESELFKSKDNITFEETLLTFWPPAPLLRTALNFNSDMIFSLSKIIVVDGQVSINRLRS